MSKVPAESERKAPSLTEYAFWLMLAKALAFVFSFALPLLLVRRLNQAEFGLYKQVFLVVNTAVTILPLGFGMSAFYFLPREQERARQVVFNIVLFNGAVGALACLTLAVFPSLLAAVFNSAELTAYAPLIGLVVLLWIVASFLEIVTVAHQEAKLATVFIIAAQFTRTFLLLATALVFGTVRALIWAAVIQGLLQCAVMLFYLRSRFPRFWGRFDWPMLRTQLSYALPLSFSGLIFLLQNDLHNYVVSNRFGSAAYAIYSIGCFHLPLVNIIKESVGSVMIGRVSYLQKQESHRDVVLLTARVMRKLAAVYFPLYLFLLILARELIVVLFTDQYLASLPIFLILLTTLPFDILVHDPITRAYTAQSRYLVKLRAVLFVVLLGALWFSTMRFGLVGAISVVVGVNLIERFFLAVNTRRLLGVTRRDLPLLKDVGKVALAALAAAIVTLAARSGVHAEKPVLVLVICATVFGAVYGLLMLLLGVLTPDERRAIRDRLARVYRFLAPWKRAAEPLAPGVDR